MAASTDFVQLANAKLAEFMAKMPEYKAKASALKAKVTYHVRQAWHDHAPPICFDERNPLKKESNLIAAGIVFVMILVLSLGSGGSSSSSKVVLAPDGGVRGAGKASLTSSDPKNFIFVHVDKTGGSTMDVLLRSNCQWYRRPQVNKDCLSNLGWVVKDKEGKVLEDQPKEPVLSKLTQATMYMGAGDGLAAKVASASHFLVSVRNPIDRAISAFNVGHPSNMEEYKVKQDAELPGPLRTFYADCFRSMEDYVKDMYEWTTVKQKGANLTEAQQLCFDKGNATFMGEGSKYSCIHYRYNYQFYADLTFRKHPDAGILVLRTEYLWEDAKKLDKLLGGNGKLGSGEGKVETHGSENFAVKSGLTPEWTKALCCFIPNEIQIYEDLIRQSLNLEESDKTKALKVVYEQCGISGNTMSKRFDWGNWWSTNADCPKVAAASS